MKLPCAVVRDLLPLYAEKMTEPETQALVKAHLAECPECQKKLSEITAEPVAPVDTAGPLATLKKQLRKRRLHAALIAGLLVFIVVFTCEYHANSLKPIPWEAGLVEVAGVETIKSEDQYKQALSLPAGQEKTPEQGKEGLALKLSGKISGAETEIIEDADGTITALLQAFGRSAAFAPGASDMTGEMMITPVPDRLIYGYQEPQALLWGAPLNGGVQVLPRLALAFYWLFALGLAALLGLLWFILRKKPWSPILRQLFFTPLAYAAAHLLLMGWRATSFFIHRDLGGILLTALAIYALLSLLWQVWRQRKKEK